MDKTTQKCHEALAMLAPDGDISHWTDAHTRALTDSVAASAEERERIKAAERERIKAAVFRCTLRADDCDGDSPEVDEARKALACTILAAICGYESPDHADLTGDLFSA